MACRKTSKEWQLCCLFWFDTMTSDSRKDQFYRRRKKNLITHHTPCFLALVLYDNMLRCMMCIAMWRKKEKHHHPPVTSPCFILLWSSITSQSLLRQMSHIGKIGKFFVCEFIWSERNKPQHGRYSHIQFDRGPPVSHRAERVLMD